MARKDGRSNSDAAIVEIGDEASIMFAAAVGDQDQLEAEGGPIETLDIIHDSIDVGS